MNANTKRRQRAIRKAVIQRRRDGLPAIKGGGKIISCGSTKNVQQVVLHNVGEDGKKHSVTQFVRVQETKPQYRREFKPTHDRVMGRAE